MNKIRIHLLLPVLAAAACKDDLVTMAVEQVPIVTFDTAPAVYPVKVGREFTVTTALFCNQSCCRHSPTPDRPAFTQVLPRLSEQTRSVTDCGYNPTYQQMPDGETGAESK